MPKKILIVFHNRSNYFDGFIMKEFVRGFKKQFTCLGGNTKKYITFTFAVEKEVTRINKNGEKITKKAYNYILQITPYNSLIVQDLWQAHYQI